MPFLDTEHGFRLAVDWYRPKIEPRAVVVAAAAMGVKRQFYRPLLTYLAEHGLASVIADYRGIGESLDGPLEAARFDLKDWGEQDLPAVLRLARAEYPGLPLMFFGHSVGGQLFGLLEAPEVDGAVFIGSQSGYWRHWSGVRQAAMFGVWHFVIPLSVSLTGRLPMAMVRQGEDLPPRVARQWAEWGRDPGYIQRYAKRVGPRAFSTFCGRISSFAIADDGFAPPRSVEALNCMYEKANINYTVLEPDALGVSEIGHFGAFRTKYRNSVWPHLKDALLPA